MVEQQPRKLCIVGSIPTYTQTVFATYTRQQIPKLLKILRLQES
jgi:hypothetical protein